MTERSDILPGGPARQRIADDASQPHVYSVAHRGTRAIVGVGVDPLRRDAEVATPATPRPTAGAAHPFSVNRTRSSREQRFAQWTDRDLLHNPDTTAVRAAQLRTTSNPHVRCSRDRRPKLGEVHHRASCALPARVSPDEARQLANHATTHEAA
jgi:hypothetical protein